VLPVAVLVDPFADGIANEGRLVILGPGAPVGIDAPRHDVFVMDVGDLRRDDEFHRSDEGHDARHTVGNAGDAGVQSLPALKLVLEAPFQHRMIFSGACCPRPEGLDGSHWIPTPGGRFHCPDRSGYLPRSMICADAADIHNAAVSAMTPLRLRSVMTVLLVMVETGVLM